MQQRAIDHIDGPARILAGPGSGKTFTIVQRLFHLILDCHIEPDKILTITFTKAAALEMQGRYLKESEKYPMLNNRKANVNFGTFHGICYAILRESGFVNGFSIIKESEKRMIMETVLKNTGIEGAREPDRIADLLSCISRKKNFCKDLRLPGDLTEDVFEQIFFQYKDMMSQQKLLDFDDMLLLCLKYLKEKPCFCQKWRGRFCYFLVDEFQDVNEVQYQILKCLAAPENNLFVVGDDDQAIYGFRGAAPGIMKKFKEDYPDAAEMVLAENYRSGGLIVSLAGKMIRENKDRIEKSSVAIKGGGRVIWRFKRTRMEEEESFLKDIKALPEKNIKKSAVILRTNAEAVQYAALLKKNGIAVRERVTARGNPLINTITEDCRAFLRFVREGNRRKDFLAILNKPNIYLSRQALTEEIIRENSVLLYYRNNKDMQQKIKKLFGQYQTALGLSPAVALRYFRKVMGYDTYLKQKHPNIPEEELTRAADEVQMLFSEMKDGEGVDAFYERIQEKQGESAEKKDSVNDGISVITMHGAKGLEFDAVFLPDLNEGVIPSKNCKEDEELEEERRLLYVAITRAEESLYLYYTRERNRKPTRFLEKFIPPQSL